MSLHALLPTLRRALVAPVLVGFLTGVDRAAVARDVRRLMQPRLDLPLPAAHGLGDLLDALARREFRSVFYERLRAAGPAGKLLAVSLRLLYPPQFALQFSCGEIGPGLYVAHGFATIVVAKRIGTDCLISQQVTIGYSDKGGGPTLGDRVRVGAGALILGPLHVGDDAVVGAGAVVVKDVPPGKVVAGVPARVVEGAEDRYSALRATGS
jgi:serine O-acetyltransferase